MGPVKKKEFKEIGNMFSVAFEHPTKIAFIYANMILVVVVLVKSSLLLKILARRNCNFCFRF